MKAASPAHTRLGATSTVILIAALLLFVAMQPWHPAFVLQAFDAGAGREVLPVEIQEMRIIAIDRNLREFALSTDLYGNEYALQRSTEYLYPSRLTDGTRPFFAIGSTNHAAPCRVIARAQTIVLCAPDQ